MTNMVTNIAISNASGCFVPRTLAYRLPEFFIPLTNVNNPYLAEQAINLY
jgi:hypothetical protein